MEEPVILLHVLSQPSKPYRHLNLMTVGAAQLGKFAGMVTIANSRVVVTMVALAILLHVLAATENQ